MTTTICRYAPNHDDRAHLHQGAEVMVVEKVYLHEYRSVPEAIRHLGGYFSCYNGERLVEALNYQTPAAVYRQLAEGVTYRDMVQTNH